MKKIMIRNIPKAVGLLVVIACTILVMRAIFPNSAELQETLKAPFLIATGIGVLIFFLLRLIFLKFRHHSRRLKNLLVPVFIAGLCLPLLNSIVPLFKDMESFENKAPAKKPKLLLNSIDTYTGAYEEYFNDSFYLRNRLVFLNNFLDFKLLGVTPIPDKVVIGKNGWLFKGDYRYIKDYKGLSPFSARQLKRIKNKLEWLDKKLENMGSQFYFIVVPLKSTIYPEFMPDTVKPVTNTRRLAQIVDYLEKNSYFRVIDIRRELLLEKKRGIRLYRKKDLHWNDYGNYLGCRKLINKIRSDFPAVKPPPGLTAFRLKYSPAYGGLAKQILGKYETENRLSLKYKHGKNPKKGKILDYEEPNPRRPIRVFEMKSKKLPKIVVFGDSFSWGGKYLSRHFRRSVFVFKKSIIFDIVKKEKPDIVVLEMWEPAVWMLTRFNQKYDGK